MKIGNRGGDTDNQNIHLKTRIENASENQNDSHFAQHSKSLTSRTCTLSVSLQQLGMEPRKADTFAQIPRLRQYT